MDVSLEEWTSVHLETDIGGVESLQTIAMLVDLLQLQYIRLLEVTIKEIEMLDMGVCKL